MRVVLGFVQVYWTERAEIVHNSVVGARQKLQMATEKLLGLTYDALRRSWQSFEKRNNLWKLRVTSLATSLDTLKFK